MLPHKRKAIYEFTLNNSILEQIKQRRLKLGLKQSDMLLRAGISRQQYQRLEAKGNPRLETLDLVAQGLNSELMLIPKEQVAAVRALLAQSDKLLGLSQQIADSGRHTVELEGNLLDDPWQGLLGEHG